MATFGYQQQKDAEIAALRAENEKLKDDIRQMVEKTAAKTLDGYRELGDRAAQAENQRGVLRARVEALEAFVRKIQSMTDSGTIYDMTCALLEQKP